MILAFSSNFFLNNSALNIHFNVAHLSQNSLASSLDKSPKTGVINISSIKSGTISDRVSTSYCVYFEGNPLAPKMSFVDRSHIVWNTGAISLSFALIV